MPFTVSHVAAVLPLVAGRRTARLAPAALVIGSMVPDVPWFFTGGRGAALTHSPEGVVTVNLAVGLVLFALWRLVFAAPARELLPPAVGRRLPQPSVPRGLDWALAGVGVLVGAASHVLWDAFTHDDRWGVRQIGWLQEIHAGLPGYKIAQYASGVVGLGLLVAWAGRQLVQTREVPATGRPTSPGERAAAWAVVVLSGAVVATVAGVTALTRWGSTLETALFAAVTRGGAAALTVLTVTALLWHVRRLAAPGAGALADDEPG
jgi:hypothetical protein